MTTAFRLIILMVTALACTLTARADNTSAEINAIKRASGEYIYAESTMPEESEARHNADNLLISNINSYFEETSPSEKFTPALARSFKYMKMKRGGGIRVFAYISKADLGGKAVTETPAIGPVENPVEEAPSPSGPETTAPTQQSPAEEPLSKPAVVELSSAQRGVVDDLLSAKDMQTAMKLLSMFEAMRKIKRYGTVNDAPSDTTPFWLIGTADFNIDTIISGGESTINMKTGQPDNANSHKGVPMLWFILK